MQWVPRVWARCCGRWKGNVKSSYGNTKGRNYMRWGKVHFWAWFNIISKEGTHFRRRKAVSLEKPQWIDFDTCFSGGWAVHPSTAKLRIYLRDRPDSKSVRMFYLISQLSTCTDNMYTNEYRAQTGVNQNCCSTAIMPLLAIGGPRS